MVIASRLPHPQVCEADFASAATKTLLELKLPVYNNSAAGYRTIHSGYL